jgi:quercetin dioxygenase-like cupin family protein
VRQFTAVAFLVLALIAGAFGMARAQTPEPQDSEAAPITTETAPASEEEIPGASVEVFADVTTDSGTAGMTLYQITLEPGVVVPSHEHYGSVTWYVDSGTLAFELLSGEVWVRCAADCVPGATLDASGFALVPEGTEVVLEAGDWIIQHDATVHAYRNAGDTDVVIDASTTYSLEEEQATPEAGDPGPAASPAAGPPITIRSCRGGCM